MERWFCGGLGVWKLVLRTVAQACSAAVSLFVNANVDALLAALSVIRQHLISELSRGQVAAAQSAVLAAAALEPARAWEHQVRAAAVLVGIVLGIHGIVDHFFEPLELAAVGSRPLNRRLAKLFDEKLVETHVAHAERVPVLADRRHPAEVLELHLPQHFDLELAGQQRKAVAWCAGWRTGTDGRQRGGRG